jgi:hypothetical protein
MLSLNLPRTKTTTQSVHTTNSKASCVVTFVGQTLLRFIHFQILFLISSKTDLELVTGVIQSLELALQLLPLSLILRFDGLFLS